MTVNLDTVNNCQAFLNAESKQPSRLDIMKEVLYHPILDVGVGLSCPELKCFSLKVIGFSASDMSDQNILLLIKLIFPKETENFLRNTKTTI